MGWGCPASARAAAWGALHTLCDAPCTASSRASAPLTPPRRLTPTYDAHGDRATAKLLGAALGGDSGDIEMGGSGIAASFEPSWVVTSERIKAEMALLKERMGKLKE